MKQIYKETDIAKITITFSDITDEERNKVFKNFAEISYKIALDVYKSKLKDNKD